MDFLKTSKRCVFEMSIKGRIEWVRFQGFLKNSVFGISGKKSRIFGISEKSIKTPLNRISCVSIVFINLFRAIAYLSLNRVYQSISGNRISFNQSHFFSIDFYFVLSILFCFNRFLFCFIDFYFVSIDFYFVLLILFCFNRILYVLLM